MPIIIKSKRVIDLTAKITIKANKSVHPFFVSFTIQKITPFASSPHSKVQFVFHLFKYIIIIIITYSSIFSRQREGRLPPRTSFKHFFRSSFSLSHHFFCKSFSLSNKKSPRNFIQIYCIVQQYFCIRTRNLSRATFSFIKTHSPSPFPSHPHTKPSYSLKQLQTQCTITKPKPREQ